MDSISAVDNLADKLVQTISDAIRATGRRGSAKKGRTAPWWTSECLQAKRQYWRRKSSEATTDVDMYQMARWAKSQPTAAAPPLQTPDSLVSDPGKRAILLRDLLLGRFTSQNDVDAEDFEPGRGNLPWVSSVTDEEAKWVTTACQNKAPGADAISVRLLRTAWPSFGHAVRVLFEGSQRVKV